MLADHRAEIAVLVSGLRGFTRFSETAAPEEVIGVMREFHEAAGDLAHRHRATVGYFSYNGLMAFLNDPIPVEDPAWQAVVLAVEMRRAGRAALRVLGAGAASTCTSPPASPFGYATVGRMGFEGRWDYKPIGPVVSLAARMFDAARAGQVLISRRTHAAVADRAEVEPLDPVPLPGYRDPIPVHAVRSIQAPDRPDAREGLTAREVEVLELLVEGISNRGIAERLVISEKTAIRHVSNIFAKLGVHSRAQAVRVAVERGLVGTPPAT